MTKAAITRKINEALCGIVTVRRRGDKYIGKRGYFYRHGMDTTKLEVAITDKLKAIGFTVIITESSDNWNAWPKDSFFKVEFSVVEGDAV